MDTSAKKILEAVSIKTLHAHGFSKSSTHANTLLADIASRYLANLVQTVANHAEHAGRHIISPRDALQAIDDLGTSVDELKGYCATESRDIGRYASHSNTLHDFRAQLALGLSHDDDDLIPLIWGPVPDSLPSEVDESEDEVEVQAQILACPTNRLYLSKSLHYSDAAYQPPLFPPLPYRGSPSPPRKRKRTATWNPPDHIPDFLPPFPADGEPQHVGSPHPIAPNDPTGLANGIGSVKAERPATPPLQAQVSTASSSADYLTVIPYEQSSLAAMPSWHLPTHPPESELGSSANSHSQLSLPQIQPALLTAYHHLLTNPPSSKVGTVNPARYRVALALVEQSEKHNRWDAPTTLFGSTAANPPRVAPMPPSYAMAIGKGSGTGSGAGTPESEGKDKGGKEEEKRPLPGAPARTVAPSERIVPSISRQGSRIPKLARHVLSGPVYTRTVRIGHPPVLSRGTQKLTYGPGVYASWNASFSPAPPTTAGPGKGKETNGLTNGKEKDKEQEAARPLPDARLYATWNYEQKRFDEPLIMRRRMGSVAGGIGGVPMGRTRSESTNA
uniref:Sensor protein zRas n=1 Tax=Ganoderma boninense TaxID=34458 RepID=A0A5K1JVF7_9APHY|nr:Sensor protein zRas [Ganoderma boninense]